MAKNSEYFRNYPTLGLQNLIFWKNTCKSFNESELGKLHSVFPFECMAKAAGLSDRRAWDAGTDSVLPPKIALMVLKAYTGFLPTGNWWNI